MPEEGEGVAFSCVLSLHCVDGIGEGESGLFCVHSFHNPYSVKHLFLGRNSSFCTILGVMEKVARVLANFLRAFGSPRGAKRPAPAERLRTRSKGRPLI